MMPISEGKLQERRRLIRVLEMAAESLPAADVITLTHLFEEISKKRGLSYSFDVGFSRLGGEEKISVDGIDV